MGKKKKGNPPDTQFIVFVRETKYRQKQEKMKDELLWGRKSKHLDNIIFV